MIIVSPHDSCLPV